MNETTTAARALLASRRDAMVAHMTSVFDVDQKAAELRIDQLWRRWTTGLAEDRDIPAADAGQHIADALAYLADSDLGTPSQSADQGWHFIMSHDTMAYAALCVAVAGWHVHHLPYDVVGLNAHLAEKCGSPCNGNGGYCSDCGGKCKKELAGSAAASG